MQALTRKLFWLSFWVVCFAVCMTGLLLYFKYQGVFAGLQRDRVLMVAREVVDIAEKDLSLGQDFWGIATLQEVLERRRGADALFIGIDVAGKDGKIAYATDASRIGSSLPAHWLEAFSRTAGISFLAPSDDVAVVGAPIRNSFDQVAGHTVIRYGRQLEHDALSRFTRELLATGAAVFVTFTMLLFAVLAFLRRHIERALSNSARNLEGTDSPPHPLAAEMALVQANLFEAGRRIAAVGVDAGSVR